MVEIEIKSNRQDGELLFEDEVELIKDLTNKFAHKLKINKIKFEVKKYNREGRKKFAVTASAKIGQKTITTKSDDWQLNLAIKEVLNQLKKTYEKRFHVQSGEWEK